MPPLPDGHAIAVMALTLVALVLFTREKIPLESSSFFILLCLIVGFELFPYQGTDGTVHAVDFFSGFGHEALVAVCALMIAGQGIVRTGALDPAGRVMARLWKASPTVSLLLTLVVSAFISAFINNVPVVVLFLPILINVSLRTGKPASSVLMPMGFATLLGGSATTIGTSTNLLVVSVAADMGLQRLAMFDFVLPALAAGGVGILYLWLVAPRIIPRREQPLTNQSPRIFAAHLSITDESPSAGRSLADARKTAGDGMKVSSVMRGAGNFMLPLPSIILQPGDHLVLRDTPDRLKEYETILNGALYLDEGKTAIDDDHPLKVDNQQLAEVIVVEGSRLQGRTLSNLFFGDRYGVVTLAIHRKGKELEKHHDDIGDIRLMAGDVLLMQGPREQIAALKKGEDLLILDATLDLPFAGKAPLALIIMLGIVLTAALGWLPIAVSAACGALLMVLTGCLEWRDATNALSVQVILIVVASLALGSAMLQTGAAEFLAQVFVAVAGTPIAISIATQMGQPPEPFVLAVLFGANMSYATPMAYKTNLLVMNAGRYTFNDFLRIGVPLVLIMWGMLSWLLPVMYALG